MYARDPAVQYLPWLKKIAFATPSAALSGSTSGSTITGDLPPSSSDIRVMWSSAAWPIVLPVCVGFVNAILSMRGSRDSAAPAV